MLHYRSKWNAIFKTFSEKKVHQRVSIEMTFKHKDHRQTLNLGNIVTMRPKTLLQNEF